ncbi:MAG: hypothetical protein ABL984_11985 [Pyrinomonadaceae bacterium]
METAWIAVIGTLAGAALGQGLALLTKRMELKHASRKEQREAMLGGVRELQLSVLTYNTNLLRYTSRIHKLRAEIDAGSHLRFDAADEAMLPLTEPLAKVQSLQLLYANEMQTEWTAIAQAYDRLITATDAFLSKQIDVRELTAAIHDLSDRCMDFVAIVTHKYLFISGTPTLPAIREDATKPEGSVKTD